VRETYSCKDYIIFDDVFDIETEQILWNYCQSVQYEFIQQSRWFKVYRLLDGIALRSPTVYSTSPPVLDRSSSVYPTGTGIDFAFRLILELQSSLVPWVGEAGIDWDYFTGRSFLYKQGDALSWHSDGAASGQWVLYIHPQWKAHWGGELMIADLHHLGPRTLRTGSDPSTTARVGYHIDSADESVALMERALGTFVLPRPNRLVVMASGVHHMIRRVDSSAGDHVRSSLTGFFLKHAQ
jgi:hypothetical protein